MDMNKKINLNEQKYKKEIEEEIKRFDSSFEIIKQKQHSLRMHQIASRNNKKYPS
jgi:hypothetical protein